MRKIIFIYILLFSFLKFANAQQTYNHTEENKLFKKGLELFEKEKYSAAAQHFEDFIKEVDELKRLQLSSFSNQAYISANYYKALCGLNLFNQDADEQFVAFLEKYPESHHVKFAYFHLGNYYYRRKRFKNAIQWFEKVDPYILNIDELSEYYFKYGYSAFMQNDIAKAEKLLFEIKDIDTKYTYPAKYYYSHIAFENKNYQTALIGFEALQDDAAFGPVVPYYIAQIYFYQKDYEKLIAYAEPKMASLNEKRSPEFARMLGEAYFKTQEYKKSIPYLTTYIDYIGKPTEEDAYQLGTALYKTGKYKESIPHFQTASTKADELAQNALYYMAHAYLKIDNKNFARNIFRSASQLSFDENIQEDALYNFCKLAYELAYNPYNEAIEAFTKYINTYPESERTEEVYKYLLNIFLTTKNYPAALNALDKINNKDREIWYAIQKISFFYGVQLYNTGKYNDAIKYFNLSLEKQENSVITAQAYFWRGEANYKLNDFENAAENFKTFLYEPGAASLDFYFDAEYNLGYAFFKLKKYPNAISWFRKYTGKESVKDIKKHEDALLKIADAYFLNTNYEFALDYYRKAYEETDINPDYVLYQAALCEGLINKYPDKVKTLEELIRSYPISSYLIKAKYEAGRTYMTMQQNQKAIEMFENIVAEYPTNSLAPRALNRIGLIYYNASEDTKALESLKRVVGKYPNTSEAKEALSIIKNIYLDQGNAEEYYVFLNESTNIKVEENTMDSTYYFAAENVYQRGVYGEAKTSFEKYLKRFPMGMFSLQANYFLADTYLQLGEEQNAITYFKKVLEVPTSSYTKNSLLNIIELYLKNDNCQAAHPYLYRLSNMSETKDLQEKTTLDLMICSFALGQKEEAIKFAFKVVEIERVSAKNLSMARLIIAKNYYEKALLTEADSVFNILATSAKNSFGAEAKYFLIKMAFDDKNYEKAENLIFEFADEFSFDEYLMAKSFIILSDIYLKKGDFFQAGHTLQSIIDNYSKENDVKKEAEDKLAAINEEQNKATPTQKRQAPEVIFEGEESNKEFDRLFNSEDIEFEEEYLDEEDKEILRESKKQE